MSENCAGGQTEPQRERASDGKFRICVFRLLRRRQRRMRDIQEEVACVCVLCASVDGTEPEMLYKHRERGVLSGRRLPFPRSLSLSARAKCVLYVVCIVLLYCQLIRLSHAPRERDATRICGVYYTTQRRSDVCVCKTRRRRRHIGGLIMAPLAFCIRPGRVALYYYNMV